MLTGNRFTAHGTSMRMPELDALRGLAAIAVIFFYFSLTSPTSASVNSWWELLLLQAGAERVTFFFVLSGFVLTLALMHRQNGVEYLAYRQSWAFEQYRKLSHRKRIVWFVTGVVLYMNAIWMPHFMGAISRYFNQITTCTGVVLIMIFCVNNLLASKTLTLGVFQFFGRISYGLYLWHFPLLCLFVATLHPYMTLEWVFLMTIVATILYILGNIHIHRKAIYGMGSTVVWKY